jgi:uncharacterized membrane protein
MSDENNPGTPEEEGEMPKLVLPHKKGLFLRLRNYFLTGIIVVAPIGITFWLAWQAFNFVDNNVKPLIPVRYNPETYLPFGIPGLGILVTIVVLTLIGAFAANFLGRILMRQGEYLVDRMPVIRNVYGALKQIFETVLKQSSTSFRQVVLIEYPRRGLWAIAFITGVTEGEVQHNTEDELINVFLPTTPNPTSGYLLFVPRKELVLLTMTVEEGIKMVISGGIVTPPDRRPAEIQAIPQVASRSKEQEAALDQPPRRVTPSAGT